MATNPAKNVLRLPVPRQKRRPQRVKCIAYPNRRRRRVFTPKKVGRIVCEMLRENPQGADINPNPAQVRVDLRRELDRCFPCGDGDQKQQGLLQEAVAMARQALQENATVIAVALSVLLALLVLPRLLAGAPPLVLALVPFAARRAIVEVPGIVARLQVQQAANATMFRRIVGL